MQAFGVLVVDCGISPNYFWDELTQNETSVLIDRLNFNSKNDWEKIRFGMQTMRPHLKDPEIDFTSLFPFSWEKSEKITVSTEPLTEAGMYAIAERMKNCKKTKINM